MAQAAVKNITDKKAKGKSLFSQKERYAGPTQGLTVHLRETNAGKFKCYVMHEKPGADKKERGMLSEHDTRAAAEKRFAEIGEQCLAAGWTKKASAAKSAFNEIPKAE